MQRAEPLKRTCANCGGPIVQGPKEHKSRYELRVYCGVKCKQRRQSKGGGVWATPVTLLDGTDKVGQH